MSFFGSKLLILWTKDEVVGHVIDVSDQASTNATRETLWMKTPPLHGLCTSSFNRFITSFAKRAVHLVVISTTIRRVVVNVKGVIRKGFLAFLYIKRR